MLLNNPTIRQTGTAGYSLYDTNITETTLGSGTSYLARWRVGGVERFSMTNKGLTTITDGALVLNKSGIISGRYNAVTIDVGTASTGIMTDLTGVFSEAKNNSIEGAVNINGLYGLARNQADGATNVRGVFGVGRNDSTTGTVTEVYGVFGHARNTNTGTVTQLYAVGTWALNDSTGIVTNAYGLYAYVGNTTTGTITTSHGVYIGDVVNPVGTVNTNYGLYIENINSGNNNFAIKTGLGAISFGGDCTAPTFKVNTTAGYKSFDGSSGATGTFISTDLKTVTVKDGIITSISGPV